MRFFIADPNLYDAGGHNMDYAAEVAEAAEARGAEVVVLSHTRFKSSDRKIQVVPLFSMGLRDNYDFTTRARAWFNHRLRQLMQRLGPLHALPAFEPLHARAGVLVGDLRRWFANNPIEPDDIWFFPTITWCDALHIVRWVATLPTRPACIDLVLRFDPPSSTEGRRDLGRTFRDVDGLRLWTDTPELAKAYAAFLDVAVDLIRMPFPSLATASQTRARPYVLYLGEGRRDKGFHHLPEFARHLAASGLDVDLYVQILADPNRDPVIAQTVAQLESLAIPRLRLIYGSLHTADYNRYLENALAMVCLYDADAYQLRSAGVITQAINAGIPVIMKAHPCAPLSMIKRNECLDLVALTDNTEAGNTKALQSVLSLVGRHRRPLDCTDTWDAPWLLMHCKAT